MIFHCGWIGNEVQKLLRNKAQHPQTFRIGIHQNVNQNWNWCIPWRCLCFLLMPCSCCNRTNYGLWWWLILGLGLVSFFLFWRISPPAAPSPLPPCVLLRFIVTTVLLFYCCCVCWKAIILLVLSFVTSFPALVSAGPTNSAGYFMTEDNDDDDGDDDDSIGMK